MDTRQSKIRDKYIAIWLEKPNVSPVLRLVSMVMLLAVKDKASSVTFRRRGDELPDLLYTPETPEGHKEYEMIPPPRHLYPVIMDTLRRMCKVAAESPLSSFSFSYTETADEEKFVLVIDHSKDVDITAELEGLLFDLYTEEEAKELERRIQRNDKRIRKQLLLGATIVFALVTGGCLFTLIYFYVL